MFFTTANLARRYFALSALVLLLGVMLPTNVFASSSRAIIRIPSLMTVETIPVSASPLSPRPSRPLPTYSSALVRIVKHAHKARSWINHTQDTALHTLCRGRPPPIHSRFALHAYYALFLARTELCRSQISIIDSLPRPSWKFPTRRPPPTMPILPPPATRIIGDHLLPTRTRIHSVDRPAYPEPAHPRLRRPPPVHDEKPELDTTVEPGDSWAEELYYWLITLWTQALMVQDMRQWCLDACNLLVAFTIIWASICFWRRTYVGLKFSPPPPPPPPPPPLLLKGPIRVMSYAHMLIVRSYSMSSPCESFSRIKHTWHDLDILRNRDLVECQRWHDIDRMIAQQQIENGDWSDAVFEVIILRCWAIYDHYLTTEGLHKVEVPREEGCKCEVFRSAAELAEHIRHFDHLSAWDEDQLWGLSDSPTPSPPATPLLRPTDPPQLLPRETRVIEPEVEEEGVDLDWEEREREGEMVR